MPPTPHFTRTVFGQTQAIPEKSSRVYSTTLKDENGTVILKANVIKLEVRIHDVKTGTEVRTLTDVLSGMHATSGLFQYTFRDQDTTLLGTDKHERRVATFYIEYNSGKEYHEVEYYVENLQFTS